MEHVTLLCIDIGTSYMKAALFSQKKMLLDFIRISLPPDSPETPSHWIEAFATIAEHFAPHINKYYSKNLVITVSGHGPSTVYLDNNNKVIHYTSWLRNEAVELKQERSLYIPQIIYVKENFEAIYKKTATVMSPAEYLSYMLTKNKYVFIPNKRLLPYFWDHNSIMYHGIPSSLLPPPIATGGIIGRSHSSFAKKLKLDNGFVVSGGLDYISTIIGVGNLKPSHIVFHCGTSAIFNVTQPKDLSKNIVNNNNSNLLSFNIPSFLEEYNNIGVTVPCFNELYKKVNIYIDLPNANYKEIIQYMNSNEEEIIVPLEPLQYELINNKMFTIDDIDSFMREHIPQHLLGFAYLGLLLGITKTARDYILEIAQYTQVLRTQLDIMISGGHAQDHTLMRLLSVFLKSNIRTLNPVHAELYGNLALGLHGVSSSNSIFMFSKGIQAGYTFTPKI